jgi:hypothetical protein
MLSRAGPKFGVFRVAEVWEKLVLKLDLTFALHHVAQVL